MKYKFLIIFTLFLFFLNCATIDYSLFKKKPEAVIEKFDIDSITFDSVTFIFDVKIINHYPISINLAGVKTKFIIEGKQFFETIAGEGLVIPKNSSKTNSFKLNIKYADIINIVKDYTKKDSIEFLIEGDISIKVPQTGIPGVPEFLNFPYKLNKKVPTIKPVIIIKGFSILKPSEDEIKEAILKSGKNLNFLDVINLIDKLLKGNYSEAFKIIKPEDLDLKFGINFDVELKNETTAKIDFSYLNYEFFLNNDKIVSGTTSDIKTSKNITLIKIKNIISLKDFSQSLANLLKNKTGEFNLKGETAVKFPDEIKKEPLRLIVNEKGKMNVVIK